MSTPVNNYQEAYTRYASLSSQHKQKKGVGKAVNILAEESGSASTINNVAKVAKSGFGLLAGILPFEWLRNATDFVNGVSNALKAVGVLKTPKDIKDNSSDGLKVASATLGGVSAIGAGAKILNSLKIIHFAKFSSLLGRIPVIGAALAKFLPIPIVLNAVDVAKAGIDIGLSSKKIHRLRKARNPGTDLYRNGYNDMKSNRTTWANVAANGMTKDEVDARKQFLDSKLDALQQKKTSYEELKTLREQDLANRYNTLQAKENRANAHKRNLAHKVKKFKATRAFIKAGNLDTNVGKSLAKINAKIEKRTAEKAGLDALAYTDDNPQILTDESANKIRDFATRKVERLKLKMSNNRWDQAKEGLSIAFNIVLIVTLVAVSVLSGLALAGLAAASLPISSGFLVVSLLCIGLHFLKKFKKNHTYGQVPFEAAAT